MSPASSLHPSRAVAPAAEAPTPRGAVAWTDLPALALFVVGYFAQKPVGVDDAAIFYRYAANWAAGLGPVFNPGERVEGFSSELWTALLALAARLGGKPEVAGPAFGFAFSVVVLLLVGRWTRRVLPRQTLLHVAVPAALALSSGFAFYAASGMDTPIFAFVLLGAALAALTVAEGGRSRAFAPALMALVAVRAEGASYAVLLLSLVAGCVPRPWPAAWRRGFLLAAGCTAATLFAVLVFRVSYFHDVIPASMRAKSITTHVTGEVLAGRASVHEWFALLAKGVRYESFVIPLLALPALVALVRLARRTALEPAVLLMGAVTMLNMTVTVWACGDWMPFHRHLVTVWGFVLIGLAWAVTELAGSARVPRSFAGGLALVAVAVGAWRSAEGSLTLGNPLTARAFVPGVYGTRLRDVGRAMSRLDPPVTLVANMVGDVAYSAGSRTYVRDVLGLTDQHNARLGQDWVATYGRTDPEYTFGTPFDLLLTNTARDLLDLSRHPGGAGGMPPAFAITAAPGWLEDRFFVVTREGSAARAALEPFGGRLVPFDSTTVAVIRAHELKTSGWRIEGLTEAVVAASEGR